MSILVLKRSEVLRRAKRVANRVKRVSNRTKGVAMSGRHTVVFRTHDGPKQKSTFSPMFMNDIWLWLLCFQVLFGAKRGASMQSEANGYFTRPSIL